MYETDIGVRIGALIKEARKNYPFRNTIWQVGYARNPW